MTTTFQTTFALCVAITASLTSGFNYEFHQPAEGGAATSYHNRLFESSADSYGDDWDSSSTSTQTQYQRTEEGSAFHQLPLPTRDYLSQLSDEPPQQVVKAAPDYVGLKQQDKPRTSSRFNNDPFNHKQAEQAVQELYQINKDMVAPRSAPVVIRLADGKRVKYHRNDEGQWTVEKPATDPVHETQQRQHEFQKERIPREVPSGRLSAAHRRTRKEPSRRRRRTKQRAQDSTPEKRPVEPVSGQSNYLSGLSQRDHDGERDAAVETTTARPVLTSRSVGERRPIEPHPSTARPRGERKPIEPRQSTTSRSLSEERKPIEPTFSTKLSKERKPVEPNQQISSARSSRRTKRSSSTARSSQRFGYSRESELADAIVDEDPQAFDSMRPVPPGRRRRSNLRDSSGPSEESSTPRSHGTSAFDENQSYLGGLSSRKTPTSTGDQDSLYSPPESPRSKREGRFERGRGLIIESEADRLSRRDSSPYTHGDSLEAGKKRHLWDNLRSEEPTPDSSETERGKGRQDLWSGEPRPYPGFGSAAESFHKNRQTPEERLTGSQEQSGPSADIANGGSRPWRASTSGLEYKSRRSASTSRRTSQASQGMDQSGLDRPLDDFESWLKSESSRVSSTFEDQYLSQRSSKGENLVRPEQATEEFDLKTAGSDFVDTFPEPGPDYQPSSVTSGFNYMSSLGHQAGHYTVVGIEEEPPDFTGYGAGGSWTEPDSSFVPPSAIGDHIAQSEESNRLYEGDAAHMSSLGREAGSYKSQSTSEFENANGNPPWIDTDSSFVPFSAISEQNTSHREPSTTSGANYMSSLGNKGGTYGIGPGEADFLPKPESSFVPPSVMRKQPETDLEPLDGESRHMKSLDRHAGSYESHGSVETETGGIPPWLQTRSLFVPSSMISKRPVSPDSSITSGAHYMSSLGSEAGNYPIKAEEAGSTSRPESSFIPPSVMRREAEVSDDGVPSEKSHMASLGRYAGSYASGSHYEADDEEGGAPWLRPDYDFVPSSAIADREAPLQQSATNGQRYMSSIDSEAGSYAGDYNEHSGARHTSDTSFVPPSAVRKLAEELKTRKPDNRSHMASLGRHAGSYARVGETESSERRQPRSDRWRHNAKAPSESSRSFSRDGDELGVERTAGTRQQPESATEGEQSYVSSFKLRTFPVNTDSPKVSKCPDPDAPNGPLESYRQPFFASEGPAIVGTHRTINPLRMLEPDPESPSQYRPSHYQTLIK